MLKNLRPVVRLRRYARGRRPAALDGFKTIKMCTIFVVLFFIRARSVFSTLCFLGRTRVSTCIGIRIPPPRHRHTVHAVRVTTVHVIALLCVVPSVDGNRSTFENDSNKSSRTAVIPGNARNGTALSSGDKLTFLTSTLNRLSTKLPADQGRAPPTYKQRQKPNPSANDEAHNIVQTYVRTVLTCASPSWAAQISAQSPIGSVLSASETYRHAQSPDWTPKFNRKRHSSNAINQRKTSHQQHVFDKLGLSNRLLHLSSIGKNIGPPPPPELTRPRPRAISHNR